MTATPTNTEPLRRALAARCYSMSESHLSGYRIIIGFNTLPEMQDAVDEIAKASNWVQSADGKETVRALAAAQDQPDSPGREDRESSVAIGYSADEIRMAHVLWDESGQGGVAFATQKRRYEVARSIVASLRQPAPSAEVEQLREQLRHAEHQLANIIRTG